jgi:hypothetical protein
MCLFSQAYILVSKQSKDVSVPIFTRYECPNSQKIFMCLRSQAYILVFKYSKDMSVQVDKRCVSI